MADLTVLIPARNEMFLARTIEDILANSRADTEIIAVLDGKWADPPIVQNPRVHVIYHSQPIGQRAATNEAARLATSPYLMKCDAHCAFAEGFDSQLLADIQPNWTIVPIMRNLHAFDWLCEKCGKRIYQGPTPAACPDCGGTMKMDVVWIAKPSPQSRSYCFDATPHFQYFGEYGKRPEAQGVLTETMSLQGSCFMLTRHKYMELAICDEALGSWGSMGIEIACKTWLSGGRVIVDQNTWYAHMFRTQGGDFGFPYPQSGRQVEAAKTGVRELFFENKWDKATRPLSWLVQRFWPVPGWTESDLVKIKQYDEKVLFATRKPTVGIVYYTDNRLDPAIMQACQTQLRNCSNGNKIVSVSLAPLDFGDKNITIQAERGYLTMFRQILAGLEALDTDIVFFCEHDVLYHPSHFNFLPPRDDVYYYNLNVWKVDAKTGHAIHYITKQTSGLCAYRNLLLQHYRERVRRVEAEGFSRKMGFEPGSHHRNERVDDYPSDSWESEYPNIDIRHDKNLTPSRWRQDQFRDRRNCQGWIEADEVPGWGVTKGNMTKILST